MFQQQKKQECLPAQRHFRDAFINCALPVWYYTLMACYPQLLADLCQSTYPWSHGKLHVLYWQSNICDMFSCRMPFQITMHSLSRENDTRKHRNLQIGIENWRTVLLSSSLSLLSSSNTKPSQSEFGDHLILYWVSRPVLGLDAEIIVRWTLF